jgi:glycopeptide antibiotics resistance protein
MKTFLYWIVEMIARAHSRLLKLNDAYEYNFSDKELHFLVIGVLGMLMIFVVHPIFKWLVKNDHIMVVSWIYVFTLIIVITFAIEIGQRVTDTGVMEFADIVFGVLGFISMFLVFSVIRGFYHLILRLIRRRRGDEEEEEWEDEMAG